MTTARLKTATIFAWKNFHDSPPTSEGCAYFEGSLVYRVVGFPDHASALTALMDEAAKHDPDVITIHPYSKPTDEFTDHKWTPGTRDASGDSCDKVTMQFAEQRLACEFSRAPDVEELAAQVIAANHPHLLDQDVRYLFRSDPEFCHNGKALATAGIVSGRNAWLANPTDEMELPKPFFLISVHKGAWDKLNGNERAALLDHELCHCVLVSTASGEERPSIRPHDVEEFQSIVERHGLWRPDLARFVGAAITEYMGPGPEAKPDPQEIPPKVVVVSGKQLPGEPYQDVVTETVKTEHNVAEQL